MRAKEPVLVSAHRCGAGGDRALENTRVALENALDLDVDFVEFDVQRCADGVLVLYHDDWMWVEERRVPLAALSFEEFSSRAPHFLRYEEVLDALAGVTRAHIDLKFTSPASLYAEPAATWEVQAARRAVQVLGADQVIVTTLEDKAVRAVRDWSDAEGHDLLVGLSLGRSVRGLPWHRQARIRASELLPRLRYTESRANLVVAKHTLARFGVAAFARRRGLPLLVWTVDTEDSLRYWMRPGRAWLVTSNEPALALTARDGYPRHRSGRTPRPPRAPRTRRQPD
ncbi:MULTISPECIES: glycerophosphodiester phosphodiesterase [Nocardioides]|uniref:Glycerophosphoryl diester phosphodiesterase n=1 Tax=Nocardioides salarius TaxID=374513 RepID=A0ABS2M4T6_9ACTN|nr:glycerophosphodiester phosphodiesterase [Nocardioides salarius]MBM7506198.1 glycerophosphoryl diester phosphodiesterase [Nocardioides salarius]